MARFLSLLKVQFLSYFGLNNAIKAKGKKKVKKVSGLVSVAILYVVIFGLCAVVYSNMFADILTISGNIESLLPLMLALSALISFFFSFYTATGALYGFKDYDLLSSLPIKTGTVVGAKLAFMYLSDLFFALIIMIPSTVIYAGYAPLPDAAGFVGLILMVVVSPFLPMTISVFLGGLVAFISSRFKRKNVVQIIMWILFFILCFGAGFIGGLNAEEMIDPTAMVAKIYFVFPLAVKGMQNIFTALLFVAANLLPFILVAFVVAKTYKKMNSLLTAKKTVKNYKYKSEKVKGQKKALFIKEIKRFFSNATYVMNCFMGSVMGVIAAVGAGIIVSLVGEETGVDLASVITAYFPLVFSFCYMLSPSTACSISLEGSAIWIIRTAPVETNDIFNAKLKVNVAVAVIPAVLAALLYGIICGLNALVIILLVALAGAIAMLGGEIGLIMNILFPKLKWDNETVPVKQGGATFFAMLAAFAYTGILFLIVYFLPISLEGLLLCCLILTLVLLIIAHALIIYKGESLLLRKL